MTNTSSLLILYVLYNLYVRPTLDCNTLNCVIYIKSRGIQQQGHIITRSRKNKYYRATIKTRGNPTFLLKAGDLYSLHSLHNMN